MNIICANININNLPKDIDKNKYMVIRRVDENASLWYYGQYDTEEKATKVAIEINNGLVIKPTENTIDDRCDVCKKSIPTINIKLTDGNKSQTFCPNCLTIECLNGRLKLINNILLDDDITGDHGAVKFESQDETYTLEAERMKRLILCHLHPNEHKALVKKYGSNKYMLHSDFYDSKHKAIQPFNK